MIRRPAVLGLALLAGWAAGADAAVQLERSDRIESLRVAWRFAPGDDPARARPEFDDSGWRALPVPTGWGPQGYSGPFSEWAWYRLEVQLGPEALAAFRAGERQLAVTLGSIDSAYELFVQGERVGGVGDHDPPRPDYDRHATWRVPSRLVPADGRLQLALRTWSSGLTPNTTGALISGPWRIGPEDLLLQRALRDELPAAALALAFAILGLVHLQLAQRRRELTEYLRFGLLALFAALYTLARSQWKYDLSQDFVLLKRVEHVILYAAAYVFIDFLFGLLERRVPLPLRFLQAAYLLGGAAVAFSPGLSVALALLSYYHAALLLVVGTTLWVVGQGLRGGAPEARAIAVGVALAAASFLNDVAVDRGLIVGMRLVPWGFAALLISTTLSLAGRFTRAYAELQTLREELADRVEQRTRDLSEANAELSEASRAQSRFLANVTHEIRTPMTGLVGMIGLLMETPLSAEQREYVEGVRASAETLMALTNDILDLAKLEAGHLELEEVAMDLAGCVEDVTRTHAAAARRKQLRLVRQLEEGVPRWVHGDPVRLRQALGNLLANAVKFTDRGEVALRLSAQGTRGSQVQVRFDVIDTGVGISPDARGRLFRAFSQIHSPSSRWFGGTGLGLAISQSLVQRMGGSIEVESQPDQGSRFSFALWLEPARAEDVVPEGRIETLELAVREGGGEPLGQLLVVEDDAVNARVTMRLLDRLGYQSELAENGLEAVAAACGRREFDAVLMDCQMPEMDGFEATARIRAREIDRRVPILALTAGAVDRARCLAVGMDDFLSKPFTARQLQRTLDRWVGGVSDETPAATAATASAGLAAVPTAVPTVDREPLDELSRFVSPAFLVETIDAFLVLGERSLGELQLAAAARDAEQIERGAHRLCGSAGATGARRFAELCARLEREPGSWERVERQLAELSLEFERVRAALAVERRRAE